LPDAAVKQVVAAVIVRAERILICQRTAQQPFPLQWEFPGGKVEKGEDFPAALARELYEELGIRATIGRQIATVRHDYAEGLAVELHFFLVPHFEGELQNRIFNQLRWELSTGLDADSFLEADRAIVRSLKSPEL
jgi:8-oxo-dGTP diphosphatase